MIKKIVILLFLVITSSNAQSIMWSNFFDIHSLNSLGGLSQNFVKDSDGNIIVAVVEFDILKLYKIDNQGNITAVGYTDLNNLPTTPGAYQTNKDSNNDVYDVMIYPIHQ